MINVVMTGVPGRRDRADFERSDADNIVVLQNFDALLGDRRDAAPESFHVVAVEARGGSDELGGIDEVGRAARMHINRGAKFREAPRGAGMVEMNVAEKNVPDVFRGEMNLAEFRREIFEGRLGPGIEEDQAFVSLERGAGDDAGATEMMSVENVDHSSKIETLWGAQAASL